MPGNSAVPLDTGTEQEQLRELVIRESELLMLTADCKYLTVFLSRELPPICSLLRSFSVCCGASETLNPVRIGIDQNPNSEHDVM